MVELQQNFFEKKFPGFNFIKEIKENSYLVKYKEHYEYGVIINFLNDEIGEEFKEFIMVSEEPAVLYLIESEAIRYGFVTLDLVIKNKHVTVAYCLMAKKICFHDFLREDHSISEEKLNNEYKEQKVILLKAADYLKGFVGKHPILSI